MAKVREEQLQFFSKRATNDKTISFDDIDSLPYMRYCMNESLRISPPAFTTAFFAFSQPVTIGEYTIRADNYCMINIYALHHN